MTDKDVLIQRIRQLMAIDMNAADIYSKLSDMTRDASLKERLLRVSHDEERHVRLSKGMLEKLETAPLKQQI